jgi:hypothetical protein
VTISNSTALASALVQGCSSTDLRLTLAAYRHGASSFVLLASATLYPVPDGTPSQVLQIPTCSTDVVLIRGIAPTTVSTFSMLLARTGAPGCGATPPPSGSGDPGAPPPASDGSSGQGSSQGSGDGSDPSEPAPGGGDSSGTEPTGDGSSGQTDAGSGTTSSGDSGTHDATGGGSTDSSGATTPAPPAAHDPPRTIAPHS